MLVVGSALLAPALPAAEAEPLREPIEAKLEALDGGAERLSGLRGRRLLLDLWATWCAPCREQFAVVRDAADELARLGVEVLAVNVGESRKLVERFVAETPPHGRVLLDRGQRIARQLEIASLPGLVLLREDGTPVAVREGVVGREQLLALLESAFSDSTPTAPP